MIVDVVVEVLVESNFVVVVALSVGNVAAFVVDCVVVVVFTLWDTLRDVVTVTVCFSCSVVGGSFTVDVLYDVLGRLGAAVFVVACIAVGNRAGESLMQKKLYKDLRISILYFLFLK